MQNIIYIPEQTFTPEYDLICINIVQVYYGLAQTNKHVYLHKYLREL